MTNAELLDLLRESLGWMREVADRRGRCPDCEECDRRDTIIAKAEAALAERQDSARDSVEWREGESIPSTGCQQWRADITEDVCVNVWLTSPPLSEYAWEVVYNSGDSKKTLAEAKDAALAAARGLR